jgi:hypothetical protein
VVHGIGAVGRDLDIPSLGAFALLTELDETAAGCQPVGESVEIRSIFEVFYEPI